MESSDAHVEPDHARAEARKRPHARPRRQQERENSVGLVITISLSFVLFAAAVLLGGHVVIAPLLQRAAAARDMHDTGEVIYAMPDGVFCNRASFDNTTGDMSEGGIEECPDRAYGKRLDTDLPQFKWGSH